MESSTIADGELSNFSERLAYLSNAAGLPHRGRSVKLATICGVSSRASIKWLNGEALPSKANAEKLAAALGATSSYLLFGESANAQAPAPLPVSLAAIQQKYREGRITNGDLHLIEEFANLLARKNLGRDT